MKRRLPLGGRTLALAAILLPLLGLFIYVALRSGPLAAVPVTVATVVSQPITPALFGIGTVEARYTYKIGPTVAARVRQVQVQVGEYVRAGQLLGEMDPVDLDARIGAQEAALKRAASSVAAARAQVQDVSARKTYADAQARRYEQLLQSNTVSADAAEAKRQEAVVAEASLLAAQANLEAAQQEHARASAEREGLLRQRANLRLVAPVDGLVTARAVDPGTTVVAGQAVVEMIDPASLWVNVRFDQVRAAGLRAELPARIVLRSQPGRPVAGHVQRIEPLADAVTEELLAKVVFDNLPQPLPPIGELVEVTVSLPELPAAPVVSNASVQRVAGTLGVWLVEEQALRFAPIRLGVGDLDGWVQVLDGLHAGQEVVVYSARALTGHSRIERVERMPGSKP